MDSLEIALFYFALFGIGTVVSIGIPIGTMIYQVIKDRKRLHKPVPIVLRMLAEDGTYEELIGIPHDMVVEFLEGTYNVKIITKKPKPPPTDKELLKWIPTFLSKGRVTGHGSLSLDQNLVDYYPTYMQPPPGRLNISTLLGKLEERKRRSILSENLI